MPIPESYFHAQALEDFHRARQRAVLKEIAARLTGAKIDLLSFEDVRQNLKAKSASEQGLREIPLDAIVGSVNRYTDFTRDFLPRSSVDQGRWARVEMAINSMVGTPPIDVYQIGEVYFVKDGNHRVSVARQIGASHIQAYVTQVRTRVPLTPDTTPDELILKAEYADFLENTHLDESRPGADLRVTAPGQYPVLEEHIAVHRYYMGEERGDFVSFEEAAARWYDTVYLPIRQVIWGRSALQDFPGRTETDLYLWIAEHRAGLEKEFGREIRLEDAAGDLTAQFSSRPDKVAARLSDKLKGAIMPTSLESGPSTGAWRKEKLALRQDDLLFADILVPVNGQESGWFALQQAILVAQREDASLHGLHVVDSEELKRGDAALAVQEEFRRRCEQAGVPGRLNLAVGEITRRICEHARWADLVTVTLSYPPAPQPLAALGSGFRSLVQRCPRPVLAVPEVVTQMQRALLAYDGSPKSEEALFVAAYLAAAWKISLSVVSVVDNGATSSDALSTAQEYLESRQVTATYRIENGPVAETILKTAVELHSDLLLMGGYGFGPFLDVVLGSKVDQVLRQAHEPVLICR
ncbi:MAG: universal stress protein [Chloroflexota bacterium]|nr:MAG: universal stress protein [Chloroflexota bacterium]